MGPFAYILPPETAHIHCGATGLPFFRRPFLAAVLEQYNRPRLVRLEQEKTALRPLPRFRFADYDIEQLTVRRTSTIEVRRVVYSMPPRRHRAPWSGVEH